MSPNVNFCNRHNDQFDQLLTSLVKNWERATCKVETHFKNPQFLNFETVSAGRFSNDKQMASLIGLNILSEIIMKTILAKCKTICETDSQVEIQRVTLRYSFF